MNVNSRVKPTKTDIVTHNRVNHVKSLSEFKEIVKLARQLSLSHIGFSFYFTYDNPGVALKTTIVHDPRTIQPVKLALVLAESRSRTKAAYHQVVVDVGKPRLVKALKPLFGLKVPFVGYDLKPTFFCLWQLGLPVPETVWDGLVCEQALHLGRYHHKYAPNRGNGVAARISAKTWAKEQLAFQTSLMCACQRHGVLYLSPPQGSIGGQSDSFLASALAATKLYGRQVAATKVAGIHDHLVTVEMPFVETLARIEWTGVRVSEKRRARIVAKCDKAIAKLQKSLGQHGLTNHRSHDEMLQFFRKEGLFHQFQYGAGYSFDRDRLKQAKAQHPAIGLILALRRLEDMRNSELLNPSLVGADGCIHPTYEQLGTATGRLTCHHPSILSVDSLLRPVVVPGRSRGIGEVDWSQVEVGIAGAVFGDNDLIDMFNKGDVYAAMAQVFYRNELPKSARNLSTRKFKEKYPDLRSQMKACTLGIIYGLTQHGLANQLKCSLRQAQGLYDEFMAMFPQLRLAMKKTAATARKRGYASTITNLHRYRGSKGPVQEWEARWFINHRIQGTAAAIFKMALNRLNQLYQPYDARLIIPLHDAVIFEAPLEALKEVAELTAKVMIETLKEILPVLEPRVEINMAKPRCWNKAGKANGLSEWLRKTLEDL
jgi:DNA polymerase-1